MSQNFYTIQVKIDNNEDWLWVTYDRYVEEMSASPNFYGLVISSIEAAKKTIQIYFSDTDLIECDRVMRKITQIRIVEVSIKVESIKE